MDLPRFFLYSALAVVTYLLLLAWNDDYPRTIADPVSAPDITLSTVPELPTNTPSSSTPTPQTDVPTQVPPAQAIAANTVDQINDSIPQPASDNPNQLASGQLINVTTDNFELSIDLSGGDIVNLALSRHLRQIDNPDEPFVLLESGPNRSYVAQSGLIGTNGIDSSARAIYRSANQSYRLDPGADSLSVDLLTRDENGVDIIKRFGFERDSYVINISYIVTNNSANDWQANVFGQIKRDGFPDPSDAGGFSRTFLGFATTSDDDPYNKVEFEDIDDGY